MLQTFLSDDRMRTLLSEARTIAVIGAKDKPGQPVDRVGRYLIQAGYQVIPVHPTRKNVWGLETYTTLAEVPCPIDIVNVFRAPQYCPDHARETLALSPLPKLFWMQLGIVSPEASALVGKAGIAVVEDLCIMVEHNRLL
ncbi:CoA-binding protein [uncultured Bilophila sp.]|uniref:CoA-binding protein n=1 Tax=uncultured Bilophila sp. TaxID=529385 RepID=UPI0026DD6FC8|nr:CoA-binding protein [uncultured Bilophila sp.]